MSKYLSRDTEKAVETILEVVNNEQVAELFLNEDDINCLMEAVDILQDTANYLKGEEFGAEPFRNENPFSDADYYDENGIAY